MKLALERSVLADALRIIAPAVAKPGGLAVLACVRIDVDTDTGRATFTATNLDLTITHVVDSIDPKADEAGTVVAPAKLLANLVATLPDATVQLGLYDHELLVIAGDIEAKLNTQAVDDWPRATEVTGEPVALDEHDRANLAAILPMVSPDRNRTAYLAVHVDGEGHAFTTDSYRMGYVGLTADLGRASIPAEALHAVLRTTGDDLAVAVDEHRARFTSGITSWVTSLIEADMPPVTRIIGVAEAGAHTLTVDRDALAAAVKRAVSIGLGDDTDASGKPVTGAVRLTVDGGKLSVSVRRASVGRVEELIDCECDADSFLGFNPTYLVDLLNAHAGDRVTFKFTDLLKPTIAHDGDRTLLLMPVRLT